MKRKTATSLRVLFVVVIVGLLGLGLSSEVPLMVNAEDVEESKGAWEIGGVDARLREKETRTWDAKKFKIRPNQEKRVYWANSNKSKSALSFVYIHGFSAGPLELEPTVQRLASMLSANLFVTRLRAHGLESGGAFSGVRAEEWLSDTIEAFAVGHTIGEKVVAIGMSTGASLALLATEATTRHSEKLKPDGLILLSPNFRLANAGADLLMPRLMEPLTYPIMRIVEGQDREFEVRNDLHRERWTSRYPIEGAVQLLRVLRALENLPLDRDSLSGLAMLVLYTPKDKVVSIDEIERRTNEARSNSLTVMKWDSGEFHELASRTFSPTKIDELVQIIVRWTKLQSFSVGGSGN